MASRVSTKDLTDAIREHAATEWVGSRAAQIVNETTDRELAAMAKPARTIPAAIRKVTETVNEQVDAEERDDPTHAAVPFTGDPSELADDLSQEDPPEDEPTFEERVAAEGSYPTVDPDAIVVPDGMTERDPAADLPLDAPDGLEGHGDTLEERSTQPAASDTLEGLEGQQGDDVDDLLKAHPAPETPAEAKPLTPREVKYHLAEALVRSAADFLAGWDASEHDGITQEQATEQFAGWLAYVPRKGAWDSRLGTDPRPGK